MSKHGNRITDNALTADSGGDLIAKAFGDNEIQEKQALLDCWKQFFHWIIKNKL